MDSSKENSWMAVETHCEIRAMKPGPSAKMIQAKASPRLRMNYDLRDSAADGSQRMLNAIEPGSPLPIHRHRKSSETVVCLRGRLVEEFYDELDRICTEAIELRPDGPVVALNIPIGQWHTVRALESGTVIMEVKDGPYEPTGEEDILAL